MRVQGLETWSRDKLIAEVERLADMAAFYAKGMDEQHAEVERLRAELANKHGGDGSVLHVTRESQDALYADRDMARAEVERLRGERDIEYQRAEAYKAEVERLRGEIQDMANEHNGGWVPRIMHDEEVERLRAGSEAAGKALYRAEQEAERLREALKQTRLHREANMPGAADAWMYSEELRQAEAEVERLQRSADLWQEDCRKATLEAERLRDEVQRLNAEKGTWIPAQMALDFSSLRHEVERLREDRAKLKESATKWFAAHQKLTDIVAERNTEVERLREKNALLHKQVLGFEWRIRTGVWR